MSLTDLKPQAVRRSPEDLVEHMKSFKLTRNSQRESGFSHPAGTVFMFPTAKNELSQRDWKLLPIWLITGSKGWRHIIPMK